jgi:GNAT superfamily N-acetyltransferase
MWKRCSLAARIARFHAPVRDIPASYLEAVLADPCASVVAVHERTGWIAALASLITSGGGSAELGVLVEDAWQQHGIGRHLVARLIAVAHARHITEVTASVLTQNARLTDPLRQLPGEFTLTRHGTTLRVLVHLPPPVPRT